MRVKGEQADLNPAKIDPSSEGRFQGQSESINQIRLAGQMELERQQMRSQLLAVVVAVSFQRRLMRIFSTNGPVCFSFPLHLMFQHFFVVCHARSSPEGGRE